MFKQIPDVEAMEQLAGRVALLATPDFRIHLRGPLGAGKTTFVRGFLRALGYRGIVKSPTYTLVEPYSLDGDNPLLVYHFDLYRLDSPEELEDIGLRDYLDHPALSLVEWPEKAAVLLGPADLDVTIEHSAAGNNNERRLELTAHSAAGRAVIEAIDSTG